MTYKIVIERKAQKEAEKIPTKYQSMIDKTILSLSSDPRPFGSEKLTEKEGYRIRSGNYRILYTVDNKAKVDWDYRLFPLFINCIIFEKGFKGSVIGYFSPLTFHKG